MRPRFPLSRRFVALLACASFLAGLGTGAAEARAADVARVCARRVMLVESPGAATVAVVYRGNRVRIVRRDPSDTWRRVVTQFHTRGWLRTAQLCAVDR